MLQFIVTSYADFKSFSKSKIWGFQKKYQLPYLYYNRFHSSWTEYAVLPREILVHLRWNTKADSFGVFFY